MLTFPLQFLRLLWRFFVKETFLSLFKVKEEKNNVICKKVNKKNKKLDLVNPRLKFYFQTF